ncbi:tetratricopeptide repeat protein [Prochlorococcus sp. MIT 0603]|nr:Tetratricopeptide repeat family protein [Prochlorococcus sp. MIT 0602]KGG15732.1 Tetratricopeptide repeat family protein [Prochlorococcus sp. MIT 0603]
MILNTGDIKFILKGDSIDLVKSIGWEYKLIENGYDFEINTIFDNEIPENLAELSDTALADYFIGAELSPYLINVQRSWIERRKEAEKEKKRKLDIIFPPGFYYLGDAARAFHPSMDISLEFSCGEIVTMETGVHVASICFQEDGEYPDNEGNYHCTDGATISLIPISQIEVLTDQGSYVFYEKEFKVRIFEKSAGFGGVNIFYSLAGRTMHKTKDAEIITDYDYFLIRLKEFEEEAIKKRQSGDIDGALQILNRLYQNNKVLFNLGLSYQLKREFNKALKFYDKLIELEDNNFSYYNNRACCYEELDELERAINDYNEARKLNPKESTIKLNLSKAKQKLGNKKFLSN